MDVCEVDEVKSSVLEAPELSMDVCEVDDVSLRLTDLPVELLLHILQYLEVKFISEVLSQVSDIFR